MPTQMIMLLREAALSGRNVAWVARDNARLLDDDARDALGLQLFDDVTMRESPLAPALPYFVGPATVAAIGAQLMVASDEVRDGYFDLLKKGPDAEVAVQLLLLAREACSVSTVETARRSLNLAQILPATLQIALCRAPTDDLRRFLVYALEQAMVEGTRFTFGELSDALQSAAGPVLRGVVFAQYTRRRATNVFFADPEGFDFFDDYWRVVDLPRDTRIGIVHPVEFPQEERARWGRVFAENEVVSPFRQIDRPCPTSSADFPYTELPIRSIDRNLRLHLIQRGWRWSPAAVYHLAVRGVSVTLSDLTDRNVPVGLKISTTGEMDRQIGLSEMVEELLRILELVR